jgi:hypothetical protein
MQDANTFMIDLSSTDQSELRYLDIVMDTTNNEYIGHHTLLCYLILRCIQHHIPAISAAPCVIIRYGLTCPYRQI